MAKLFLKKKSKRQSTKMKAKITKKAKEHRKKLKKAAKKNPQKVKRKDPGIPNSLPFKETLLREVETRKRQLEEEREKIKERRKKERQMVVAKKRNLESLVTDAAKKTKDFERKISSNKDKETSFTGGKSVEISRKTFYKEFKKVIDMADVVLEVLDARDPLGSRCQQVEETIISSGANKKLVLVLNKIDLVPKENVEAWLKYLRNEFPTVAFKASTQTQNTHLSQKKLKSLGYLNENLLKTSRCLGADLLMKLLGNYCRNEGIKTSIRVGVVGLPNTGKSSIINSLKRSKACNVGATPGITKSMQMVQLDKHIKLLDSPGVVMSTTSTDTSVVLRNCAKIETLQDPVTPLEAILRRCNKTQIMLHYKITDYKDAHEFLALLAKRFGMLKKHGVPQIMKAARKVLTDWTSGKITYYTHPPEQSTSHLSAEIVSSLGKSFDIDAIVADEVKVLSSLEMKASKHMLVESLGPATVVMDESMMEESEEEGEEISDDEESGQDDSVSQMEAMDDEEVEMEESEEEKELSSVAVRISNPRKTSLTSVKVSTKNKKEDESKLPTGNLQLNKNRKKAFKQMKKQKKRTDAVVTSLSDTLTSSMAIGGEEHSDSYSFETDFVM